MTIGIILAKMFVAWIIMWFVLFCLWVLNKMTGENSVIINVLMKFLWILFVVLAAAMAWVCLLYVTRTLWEVSKHG